MSVRANERVAWFNGDFVPESEVRIPFRDSSWVYGDGCFDMTRTFGHRLFKVQEHVDRLYRSLKYLRIDPGISPERMCQLTEEVFERNRHLLGPKDDYWVGQRISRGVKESPGDNVGYYGPNVVLECNPLPFQKRAKLFKEGIRVMVPSVRRTPPASLTPRAKTHNYLNLIVADQEVQSIDPEAWAILLDTNGNLCEGLGSNIFVVKDGEILTPREKFVLPGVSRQTAMDLAAEIGPELWLVPEPDWNSSPIPPGGSRTVRFTTDRSRAPNGSALPRYTYFTVRSKTGQASFSLWAPELA